MFAITKPNLPNEMWLHILGYLSSDPLNLISTSLICRRLNQLTKEFHPNLFCLAAALKKCFKSFPNKNLSKQKTIWAVSKYAIAIMKGEHSLTIFPLLQQFEKRELKLPCEKFLHVARLTSTRFFILTDRRHTIYEVNRFACTQISEKEHPSNSNKNSLFRIKYSTEDRRIAFTQADGNIHVYSDKLKVRKIKIPKQVRVQTLSIQKDFVAILRTRLTKKNDEEMIWEVVIVGLTKSKKTQLIQLQLKGWKKSALLSNRKWIVIQTPSQFHVIDAVNRTYKIIEYHEKFKQVALSRHHLIASSENVATEETMFSLWNLKKGISVLSRVFPVINSFECHRGVVAMIPRNPKHGISLWQIGDNRNIYKIELPRLNTAENLKETYKSIKFHHKNYIIIETSKNVFTQSSSLKKP